MKKYLIIFKTKSNNKYMKIIEHDSGIEKIEGLINIIREYDFVKYDNDSYDECILSTGEIETVSIKEIKE